MRTALRHRTTTSPVLLAALAALAAAPALAAQHGPPPAQPPRAAFARVATGTVVGSFTGAAAGAVLGAALGSLDPTDDEFISSTEAFGAIGLAIGTTLGAAIGARLGATVDGGRPGLGRVWLFSAASAVAGGLVWNRVGETFEREESMSSWYAGAVAGVLLHWGVTAIAAQRAPVVEAGAVPAPGDPGA